MVGNWRSEMVPSLRGFIRIAFFLAVFSYVKMFSRRCHSHHATNETSDRTCFVYTYSSNKISLAGDPQSCVVSEKSFRTSINSRVYAERVPYSVLNRMKTINMLVIIVASLRNPQRKSGFQMRPRGWWD